MLQIILTNFFRLKNTILFQSELSFLLSSAKDLDEGKKETPPASVVARLIIITVWRKLIRNPNTYATVVGLIWSLIAFRYLHSFLYHNYMIFPSLISNSLQVQLQNANDY